MVQVDRVYQAAAHHHRPEAIDNVAAELRGLHQTSAARRARRAGSRRGIVRTFFCLSGATRYSAPLGTLASATAGRRECAGRFCA